VLFTPDDEARQRDEFHTPHDEAYETELTPQARPNVLFEAGMAMGRDERRTILVQLGKVRPFSDIAGATCSGSMTRRQSVRNSQIAQASKPVA